MNDSDGIGAYGQAWLEPDADRRRALLERAWQEDAVYSDPTDHLEGRDALVAHIGAFQQAMAGGRVEITTEATRHHDSAHFHWQMKDAHGGLVLSGFDVVQLDAEGRISRLTGFFDS